MRACLVLRAFATLGRCEKVFWEMWMGFLLPTDNEGSRFELDIVGETI